jgi:hypothetical protein
MTTLHIACPAKRALVMILARCAPPHERGAWLQDAIDAGAFTQDEGAIIRAAIDMSGDIHERRNAG